MQKILFFLFICIYSINIYAQKTVYLTTESEITNEKDKAIEYATITPNQKGKGCTIDFFSMDGTLLRNSQYAEFGKTSDKQILHGKTIYKFKYSEQDSLICYYRNNLRTGAAVFYYPNGRKHVECAYKQGLLDGLLIQYYPNNSIKRKDIYEKGVATATTIYSEEGEILGNSPFYIAPTPLDTDMNTIVRELSQVIKLPIWKKAGTWEAFVEITFKADGNVGKIQILQSNHPELTKASMQAAIQVFKDKEFIPAVMDNNSVPGNIILPIRYRVEAMTIKR